ncbi:MAG: hypothetical protein H8E34_11090, partial [Bacteroidetes bacterium]|nr:hypothetical protein [Bacteroidota bacterium]
MMNKINKLTIFLVLSFVIASCSGDNPRKIVVNADRTIKATVHHLGPVKNASVKISSYLSDSNELKTFSRDINCVTDESGSCSLLLNKSIEETKFVITATAGSFSGFESDVETTNTLNLKLILDIELNVIESNVVITPLTTLAASISEYYWTNDIDSLTWKEHELVNELFDFDITTDVPGDFNQAQNYGPGTNYSIVLASIWYELSNQYDISNPDELYTKMYNDILSNGVADGDADEALSVSTYKSHLVDSIKRFLTGDRNKTGLEADDYQAFIEKLMLVSNGVFLWDQEPPDNDPPTIECSGYEEGQVVKGTIEISCKAEDDSYLKEYKLVEPYESDFIGNRMEPTRGGNVNIEIDTVELQLSGEFNVKIFVEDEKGNSTTKEFKLVADNSGPVNNFLLPTANETISGEFEISVTADDDISEISSIKVTANGEELTNQNDMPEETNKFWTKKSADDFDNGLLTLIAVSEDAVGNKSDETIIEVTINRNAPACTVDTPESGTTVSGDVTIKVTCEDEQGIESITVTACSQAIGDLNADDEEFEGVWNSLNCLDGETTINISAKDENDIEGNKSISVVVDNVLPGSISGAVSVGSVVSNADVKLYDYTNNQKGELITETTTDDEGKYVLDVDYDNFSAPVLIEVSGTSSSFIDPVADSQIMFSTGDVLKIILNYNSGDVIEDVYVSGWTTIATNLSKCESDDMSKELAYKLISEHFKRYVEPKGISLGDVLPFDLTDSAAPGLTDSVLSGFAEIVLSQIAYNLSVDVNITPATDLTLLDIIILLSRDLQKDCIFDGKENNTQLETTTGYQLEANTTRHFAANRGYDFIISDNNQSGLTKEDMNKIFDDMTNDTSELYPAVDEAPIIDFDRDPPTFDSVVPSSGTFSNIVEFDVRASDISGILPTIIVKSPDNVTYTLQEPGHITGTIDVSGLAEGENELIFEAVDEQSNKATETVIIQINHSGPVIEISSPTAQ